MVVEEAVPLSPSPAPLYLHKRKLEDVEPEPPLPPDYSLAEKDSALKGEEADDLAEVKEVSDASEAKRARIDESKPDFLAGANGYQIENEDASEPKSTQSGVVSQEEEKDLAPAPDVGKDEPSPLEDMPSEDTHQTDVQLLSAKIEESDGVVKPSEGESQPAVETLQQGVTEENLSQSSSQTTNRRMEVPNNMVGVLIGKAGDTIRSLQHNSGAKIQITRDVDADPGSATRSVELVGTLDSINIAERLIKEVIAEADAGGSPALVARGFALPAGAMEQVQIQVPNEKVGLIIGKGGETIKSLQTRSGARIQLVPQHLPDGDESKERTVRVSGDRKQIELARELIKEVMNQQVKPSTLSGSHAQQHGNRSRGPHGALPQWGPHAPHNAPSMPYDHQQHRGGPYSSQNQQYPPQGSYPSQGPPRGGYGPGWEQRPPMQGPHHHNGGYDYHGGQGGGYAPNVPPLGPHSTGRPTGPNMGPNMNYGQPPYSQPAPSHQNFGQRYAEPKYDSQVPVQQPYGGPHGSSQPGTYQNAQGYPNQYPAGPYNAPPQPYPASQPGNVPYQAQPASVAPSYGQSIPTQQTYPYGSVPAATNGGYSQPQAAAASMSGYPQQGASQPVSGYTQPVAQQQAPGYPQAYGQYPPAHQGYGNQAVAAGAGYVYPGQADPSAYAAAQTYNSAPATAAQSGYPAAQTGYSAAPTAAQTVYSAAPTAAQTVYSAAPTVAQTVYSAAPTAAQTGYGQPATGQASYDQSMAQQGGYPAAAPAAPVASQPAGSFPQQYDASQMYGASG